MKYSYSMFYFHCNSEKKSEHRIQWFEYSDSYTVIRTEAIQSRNLGFMAMLMLSGLQQSNYGATICSGSRLFLDREEQIWR